MWRDAKSLDVLLRQVDAAFPGRDKSSDGTIGNAAHQATKSEHNPDANGVVRARDITNDPAHGFVSRKLAEALVASRDPRILYVISNREICSSVVSPWVWRPYNGANPHTAHMHLSVVESPALYDDERPWSIDGAAVVPPPAKEGHVTLKKGDHGPAVTELQGLLGITQDGIFGDATDTAVRGYQAANHLDIDGIVGPKTWGMLLGAPVVDEWQSGKGSWYSQYRGKYNWSDGGDKPNSNALGVPDDAQGISFYNHDTLGKWFEVQYPNGHVSIEQQTETGPAPWTNRLIDIAAVAAERAGYTPKTFPTDAMISWRRVSAPKEVAVLAPKQQAITYRDIRKGLPPMPDPIVDPPKPPVISTVPSTNPPISGFDISAFIQHIQSFGTTAKRDILLGISVYNIIWPKDPIKLATDATAPTAPAQTSPVMGSEHVGTIGLLTTLGLQLLGHVGPALGASATPTGQLLTLLFGGLAGAGTVGKIVPTIATVARGIGSLLSQIPKPKPEN